MHLLAPLTFLARHVQPLPPPSPQLFSLHAMPCYASTGMGIYKRKKETKSEQESIQARVNDKKNVLKKIKQIQVVLISRIDKSYKVLFLWTRACFLNEFMFSFFFYKFPAQDRRALPGHLFQSLYNWFMCEPSSFQTVK